MPAVFSGALAASQILGYNPLDARRSMAVRMGGFFGFFLACPRKLGGGCGLDMFGSLIEYFDKLRAC